MPLLEGKNYGVSVASKALQTNSEIQEMVGSTLQAPHYSCVFRQFPQPQSISATYTSE